MTYLGCGQAVARLWLGCGWAVAGLSVTCGPTIVEVPTVGNHTVLLVTNPPTTTWAQPILDSGAVVKLAESPAVALALACQALPGFDCLIVEAAAMGEGFLADVHAVLPGLPIVLLGAPASLEAEARELRAAVGTPGLCGYLTAPWDERQLRLAVDRALALADERRDAQAEVWRLRRRLDAAEVIHDLAVAAVERSSHREILELLATTLARLVAFDVCAIVLAPPGPGDTALQLHRSFPSGAAPLAAVRSRCIAELAARGGRSIGEPTHIGHSGFPANLSCEAAIATEITVPIVIDDKVCGMVTLGAFSVDSLDDDDDAIATQVVAQAAEAARRLSSRLHDERRKMSLMVESMADGVIMTDEKSEVFLINPAARRMLGLGRDVDVTAKYLKEKLGFYPFDLVARAHPAREELTIEQKTLHSIVSPVLDGIGKLVGVVVVLRDITAEKELEQRKQELVSIVSHELRTPLTSIAGALEIILASYAGGLTDKQRTYLTLARESCAKLHVMVNDLLDAARFETGKLGLSFEPLQLDELALDCVDRFRGAAESKSVFMTFTVERAARGLRIGGDADRLSQVMSNLLSNAIKFTPEGGRIEVEVFGPGAASDQVGVSVWNNGDPIPEEHHERVFEKFEQLHASRRVGGTGLGLAISRSIVEGHGGKIWVEHATVGTKFVFTLPAAPEESTHKDAAPAQAPEGDPLTGAGNRLVLVVDDDRYAAYLLKGILMSAGHRVQVAHDLDDALGWARERRPDLVVTDARLGNAGLALVEILKHDPDTRKAGVIVLSDHADREMAQAAGADAYFPKPVQVEPFRQACARLLAEKTRESLVKILVVDDDAAIRMICRDVLENAGYVVREASDGKAALAEAKRFRPDLMLLDVMMPELDGYQTAKRFRADPVGAMTPVIFVSARSQTDDKVRAFKLGAEDYLVKPFDALELLARVEKALARRERELGASPTTKLPGAGAIESEVERRLAESGEFAFCYVDLDNLKAFNDYYGIAKADGIIRQTGDLMRQVVAQGGLTGDFIGHIAGDDFVFISSSERVDQIGQSICQAFDRIVPLYYNKTDRERGYIETCDRYGVLRKFPIMSVSVAAITTRRGDVRFSTYAELASAAADAKKIAKAYPGSSYVRDGALVHPLVAKSVA